MSRRNDKKKQNHNTSNTDVDHSDSGDENINDTARLDNDIDDENDIKVLPKNKKVTKKEKNDKDSSDISDIDENETVSDAFNYDEKKKSIKKRK